MATQLPTRSPRGCLTCKQRRKKCDETKPTCQRCKQGKFKCLGYAYLDSTQPVPKPWASKSKEIPDTPLFSYEPIRLPSSDKLGLPPSVKASPAPPTPVTRPQSSLGPFPEPPERKRSDSVVVAMVPAQPIEQRSLEGVPRILRLESEHITKVVEVVLSQLSRFGFRVFMPGRVQMGAIIMRRVHRCDLLRWCMYLGAQIAQMLLDGPGRKNYLDVIRRFHRHVILDSPLSENADLTTRLGVALELAIYAFMVSDSAIGYAMVKSTAPLWYRFAAEFPLVWASATTVSLAYAICVPRYELSKFIFWDINCAVAFGIPSILRYDTTYRSFETTPVTLEHIYGCPLLFVILLAKINGSRGASTPPDHCDRQEVEMRLKQWRSKSTYVDKDSCKAVARCAIQESWRQAIYIYLYMGMCGVDSADPRVEAPVRQIVRLSGTIEGTSPLGLHLFVPCLIAGVAARAENHRAILRTRVHASREAHSWVLRGADFAPVLDHLWHGAALHGQPVKWDDYVHSRRSILKIER